MQEKSHLGNSINKKSVELLKRIRYSRKRDVKINTGAHGSNELAR
ncbi:hypothetical protein phiAS4_ORF0089 [Aeromonas phage phiAS4]|uniref:Uncharacterized protein n=1 Tax=Aeromonas phage phiAS4 TaxID=879628 RepID=E1A1D7_9CAUD|nr:hypothetical protein phiAS4_ORF0089 [Aeromonas phage phiAS4]ADM79661.1 hypothetical protein phiAS4_ORF0089 [Aeromonas phage phiAS4]